MYSLAETQVAIDSAKCGAAVLLKYFRGKYGVQQKQSYNLVSRADLESETAIGGCIRNAFPSHSILGEESKTPLSAECQHLWIIDPLDGTNNFVHGIDQFAISIGYFYQGTAVTGVVFRPVSNEWFVAERGLGAWRNQDRATVSRAARLNEAMLGVGFYYDRGLQMQATLSAMEKLFEQEIHGFRRMGAASLDLCMVGCGQLDGYFEFQLSPWDFAAGTLFVEEAGGKVTSCSGDLPGTSVSSILASNGLIHQQMLDLIEPIWRGVN